MRWLVSRSRTFVEWFQRKWMPPDEAMLRDYQHTFSTLHGQRVLQHLMDTVYCTVYEGTDLAEAFAHNARRSVVHDILYNLDRAANPGKYEVTTSNEDVLKEISHGPLGG